MRTTYSSLAQFLRLRYGLRLMRGQLCRAAYRFLFRATMAAAAVTLVLTSRGYAEQVTVLEQVAGIYSASAKALSDCEAGATGYYYPATGRAYECGKPL